MAVQKFEDLLVWQKSQALAVTIYKVFKDNNDFSFRDQIKRASVSISNNIAEGFDRNSNADFSRFLYIALSSNSEVRSMLYLSISLNFLSQDESRELIEMNNEISKMLHGLIKSIKN
ncbi:four helix bundle protein [Winogradskyella sp. J14-2]|uniref:four helix bundle protein n=1 Tax=Winogradskyella sp. J14-2 TaxID=1936080 RepID=UPI000972D99E|nr:four helix bundle protein [Winogradskyella sp. J14-2]APY08111.1 four helix bundle protein [Winogradskyella sp. J14-2]